MATSLSLSVSPSVSPGSPYIAVAASPLHIFYLPPLSLPRIIHYSPRKAAPQLKLELTAKLTAYHDLSGTPLQSNSVWIYTTVFLHESSRERRIFCQLDVNGVDVAFNYKTTSTHEVLKHFNRIPSTDIWIYITILPTRRQPSSVHATSKKAERILPLFVLSLYRNLMAAASPFHVHIHIPPCSLAFISDNSAGPLLVPMRNPAKR
ncbi:hypothetical protein K438DRAFT_1955378 [Mycena galopus ATCC 62051]|nr:hypothetical protein K438DRAFT_1955378 [Mycena galopus ATCC 62051]